LKADAVAAVAAYGADVRAGRFPSDAESYHLSADVAAALAAGAIVSGAPAAGGLDAGVADAGAAG